MVKHQRGAVTAVMNMSLFVLLLLSGLLCSASGLWREYQYININMTWTKAQSYCRERYTDLATVDSMDDVNRMMNTVNDGYSGPVWIGLQISKQSRWIWADGKDTLSQYIPWATGEPNATKRCGKFLSNALGSYSCVGTLKFACYNETTGYIKIDAEKNWTDAQSYCRQYYTDLPTVHNFQDRQQLYAAVGDGNFWIGLFVDFWQWSDQWNLTFRNWAMGHPFAGLGDCATMSTTDSGRWLRYSCGHQYPFICYGEDKSVKRQVVRLNLSHDGKYNLNDPSQQTATLNKIREKLKTMGMGGLKTINWRTNEVGEVFHLTGSRTANLNPKCDRNTFPLK